MKVGWFKSGCYRGDPIGELLALVCLSLCRRDTPGGLKHYLVEPEHLFQNCELQGFLGFPGRLVVDQFCLEQPIDPHGLVPIHR